MRFHRVIAPAKGPLMCVGSKVYYTVATEDTVLVPEDTNDMIPVYPKYCTRVICRAEQYIKDPLDIQNNLVDTVKIIARDQPIEYKHLTLHIVQMEPNDVCLLLKQDTILEIISQWERPLLPIETVTHLPVVHLYLNHTVQFPFENILEMHAGLQCNLESKIKESLLYEPSILIIHHFERLVEDWDTFKWHFLLLRNRSVIVAGYASQDVPDLEGIYLHRHTRNTLKSQQDQVNALCEALSMSSMTLKETVPNPTRHVWEKKLNQTSQQVPIEIVGMDHVKATLEKTILRPLQYKNLYASLPKLSQGVLLHGPSGTGKTAMAKSFCTQSGLPWRFIKGPEIISKYVGETEKRIRDLFSKAKQEAPFILVFDNMESLCPCRGSDTSGITDRIVNQFLTALDGAEAMPHVYLIATTSLPEQIDPALLRPGRLDTHVHCDYLNEVDMALIVQALQVKYGFKVEYQFTPNCTHPDVEAAFLKKYFDHIYTYHSIEDLQFSPITIQASTYTPQQPSKQRQTLK